MRESIGSVATYNIVMIFIVVTFAIVSGTLSYSKAFKVNNNIINAIEKYEGYNESAGELINKKLNGLGYQKRTNINYSNIRGPRSNTPSIQSEGSDLNYNPDYEICIYKFRVNSKEWNGRYFNYGVVTFIYFDFYGLWPSVIRIPVYGVTRDIFEFSQK